MVMPYNRNFKDSMPFSDTCAQVVLTANTALSWTIPGNSTQKYMARFTYNEAANVFICNNAVPVIPSSNSVGVQQYNEFRPTPACYVSGGDVLHFISPDTLQYVGVALYQLPG